jgi:hypothetical protein
MLDRGEIEANLFWDQKAAAFRETVISAIAETSTALSSRRISCGLRAELESQIEPLNFYLRIAASGIERRNLHYACFRSCAVNHFFLDDILLEDGCVCGPSRALRPWNHPDR